MLAEQGKPIGKRPLVSMEAKLKFRICEKEVGISQIIFFGKSELAHNAAKPFYLLIPIRFQSHDPNGVFKSMVATHDIASSRHSNIRRPFSDIYVYNKKFSSHYMESPGRLIVDSFSMKWRERGPFPPLFL